MTVEWQVQIYISEVKEWYGWAHTPYDHRNKTDANRAARIAKQHGWKVRVVRVH